jgi:hypothetical protein
MNRVLPNDGSLNISLSGYIPYYLGTTQPKQGEGSQETGCEEGIKINICQMQNNVAQKGNYTFGVSRTKPMHTKGNKRDEGEGGTYLRLRLFFCILGLLMN